MPSRICKFNKELQKKYPCYRKGKNEYEAVCEVCEGSISVKTKGSRSRDDHLTTKKHQECIRASSTSQKLTQFVIQKNTALGLKVAAAKVTLAFHTVKHHFSYKSMDCTSQLTKKLFDDSETARKVTCSRTKTEAIVNNVLSPHSIENVVSQLKKIPYLGIGTDGSNHGHIKLFPIVIQYFDETDGIQVRMLDFQSVKNEKSETIVNLITSSLEKHNLKEKCIAFVEDNTNTNFGGLQRKGTKNIFYDLKDKVNPEMVGVGCHAHILHNDVHHGMDRFGIFEIDCLVFNIFDYFSIYTVRVENLKDSCEFASVQHQELLNHCKTRWLSLFPAVERILQLFDALKSYFSSQDKVPAMIENFFTHDLGECFLWFVHSLMSVFHNRMKIIEKEKNSVLEILNVVKEISVILEERMSANFSPIHCKQILKQLRKDGKETICAGFEARMKIVYFETKEYLFKWTDSKNVSVLVLPLPNLVTLPVADSAVIENLNDSKNIIYI